MKKYILIVGILVAVGFFGTILLTTSKSPTNNQICPDFKKRGTTEENLALMRANLENEASFNPKKVLEANVFFTQMLSIENFVPLLKKYKIVVFENEPLEKIGSIQILSTYPAGTSTETGIWATSLETDHFEVESFYEWMKKNDKPGVHLDSIRVNSFQAKTTAQNFLQMWNENQDIVRGVGVGCTKPRYTVNPAYPVLFGGPSIFN